MSSPWLPISGVEQVDSEDPENDLWERLMQFQGGYFTEDFLQRRIDQLNAIQTAHVQQLSSNKAQHLNDKGTPALEDLWLLKKSNKNVAKLISLSAKQAHEFYTTSKGMPMLTRPIILHYAFEKLVNMLFVSTFEYSPAASHGISFDGKRITLRQKGLFPRLHDCLSNDPVVYAKTFEFKLSSLLEGTPVNVQAMRGLFYGWRYPVKVYEETTKQEVEIHEMEREFIFMFLLSSLARYNVEKWSEILEASKSDEISDIRKYYRLSELFFPMWIYSFLLGRITVVEKVRAFV